MDGRSARPPCAQPHLPEPQTWSSCASSASGGEESDGAEAELEPEPEPAHSDSSEEEDAAAAAERQRWLRARSMEWQQARAIISRRSSEEASGSESGGGSSMSDVFSSSAGGGPPVGNRLASESESDWSSAHEGFFVETAGDIARMRILELQHKGVDLPAYSAVSAMHRRGDNPKCTHAAVGGEFECGVCGPAGEHPSLGEHRHAGRPRRRAKVLSKEQKQLKRLRRRKRELEATVSICIHAISPLCEANLVLL